MSLLEIRKYPDPVLMAKSSDVEVFDEKLQVLIDNMVETMHAAPGIGLAAPQIGVAMRLAVIDIRIHEPDSHLYVCINPIIVEKHGTVDFEEGCLSLPEYTAKITRSERIVVRAFDGIGTSFDIEAEGLLAIALQHELDHLDGKLLIDRISPLRREFFKKRFKKHAGK